MSCAGKFCSKTKECKNFWLNCINQDVQQYIDWSATGHGSCYTSPDGKMVSNFQYDCGDCSLDYGHFMPIGGQ